MESGEEINLNIESGGGNNGKSGDGFIDRSKVRILLCDNDSKSSQEVFTLLLRCSYQGMYGDSPQLNPFYNFFVFFFFCSFFFLRSCYLCAIFACCDYVYVIFQIPKKKSVVFGVACEKY